MTTILGLLCFYHDSAACLLKDGEIIIEDGENVAGEDIESIENVKEERSDDTEDIKEERRLYGWSHVT